MTRLLVPEQFAEIARLSDQSRAEDERSVTATRNPELADQVRAQYEKERLGGTLHQRLYERLAELSDESFRELMGWVIFGRDYSPEEGDPTFVLGKYIRTAVIDPRNIQESYLEDKPIGEYLRNAMTYILTITSEDIERAQNGDYEGEIQEDAG